MCFGNIEIVDKNKLAVCFHKGIKVTTCTDTFVRGFQKNNSQVV